MSIQNPTHSAATTNESVMLAFIAGIPAHSANLSTDGKVLRSYHYYELAQWGVNDRIILRKGELYSHTTKSRHFNPLVKLLDKRKIAYVYAVTETDFDDYQMHADEPGQSTNNAGEVIGAGTDAEITEQDYLDYREEK